MKKILIAISIILLYVTSFSQTEFGSHTLFNTKSENLVLAYASFDCSFSEVDGYTVGSIGGTLGMTTNHSFSFGLVGSFIFDSQNNQRYMVITPEYHDPIYAQVRRYAGWGGFILEPTLFPRWPVHLTFPLIAAVGGISYCIKDPYWKYYDTVIARDWYFLFSAGARLEVNIVRSLRVSAGPSYRYVPNLDIKEISSDMMNGLSLDLSIKIGLY